MYDFEEHDIITVEELMDGLQIGKNTAYQLLNSGAIKAFRIGRTWKIPKSMLEEFIIESAKKKFHYFNEK